MYCIFFFKLPIVLYNLNILRFDKKLTKKTEMPMYDNAYFKIKTTPYPLLHVLINLLIYMYFYFHSRHYLVILFLVYSITGKMNQNHIISQHLILYNQQNLIKTHYLVHLNFLKCQWMILDCLVYWAEDTLERLI